MQVSKYSKPLISKFKFIIKIYNLISKIIIIDSIYIKKAIFLRNWYKKLEEWIRANVEPGINVGL